MQARSEEPAEEGPELRIAPDPEETEPETDVYAAIAEHLESRPMVVAKPENHLVAALLNASTTQAAEVLALVEDTDIESYMASVVIRVIRQLVTAGVEPTPQAVAARARGPLDLEGVGMYSAHPSLQRIVLYVSDIYTMGMPVRPWADACHVVEDSYRRSFGEVGRRLVQMADAFADIEELEQLTVEALHQWRAHWHRVHRLRALAYPTAPRNRADTSPEGEHPPPPDHQ